MLHARTYDAKECYYLDFTGVQKIMDAGLGIAAGLVSLRPPTSAAGSTACAPKIAKILNRNVASTSCLPFPFNAKKNLRCTPYHEYDFLSYLV